MTGETGFREASLHSTNPEPLMSALGQKQTWHRRISMSALPLKADMAAFKFRLTSVSTPAPTVQPALVSSKTHVRFTPQSGRRSQRCVVFATITGNAHAVFSTL
jgi:hypothetical protein